MWLKSFMNLMINFLPSKTYKSTYKNRKSLNLVKKIPQWKEKKSIYDENLKIILNKK